MVTPLDVNIGGWFKYPTPPYYRGSNPHNIQQVTDPWVMDYTGYTHKYVSTTGSDSNDGSELSPWRTIQHAVNQVTSGGHVINVRGGTYTENAETVYIYGAPRPAVVMKHSGSVDNYIAIRSYPGETAIIDQGGVGLGFSFVTESYLIFDDLTIRNCFTAGIYSAGNYWSSNIKIVNNHIYNMRGPVGQNVGGVRFDWTTEGYIANNKIHDVRIPDGTSEGNGNASCLHSYRMATTTIENNTLYDSNRGVFHKQAKEGEGGVIVRNNHISQIWEGIRLTVQGSNEAGVIDSDYYNNIILDAHFGVHAIQGECDPLWPSTNLRFFNNTFAKHRWLGGEPPFALYVDGVRDLQWYNNITHNIDRPIMAIHVVVGEQVVNEIIYCDYNLYYNWVDNRLNIYGTDPDYIYTNMTDWRANADIDSDMMNLVTSGPDLQSLEVDPLFTNYTSNDFTLQPSSQARNAGRTGEHIGAYSTDNTFIGVDW